MDLYLENIIKMYPNAGCELIYHNPFEFLVAVVLSAQTTDKAVNKITPILFEKYLIISERTNKVSISEFLRHAVEFYCQQNSISLYDDELNKEATANYKARLEEKENKKK